MFKYILATTCFLCNRNEKSDVVWIRKVKKYVKEIAQKSGHPLEKEVLRRMWGSWQSFLSSMTILMGTKPINPSTLNKFAFIFFFRYIFFRNYNRYRPEIFCTYIWIYCKNVNQILFIIHVTTILLKNVILF